MNLGKESEIQEFKESLSQLDKGLKSLTAMLNRNGYGTVFFGVKDNGDVIGTQVGDKTFEDIRNKINNWIEPKIVFDLSKDTTEDSKTYITLKAEGSDIPYSFDGRYYIRNVASDEKVSNELLRKMLISSSSDLIKNISSEKQDLTFNTFCNFYTSLGLYAPNRKEFFISKGLLNKENKYNLMAFLLSDQSNISIKVVKFDGIDKSAMSSRTEFGNKCLLQSVVDVLNYFNSINSTNVILQNGIREETTLFNFEAFREAWINACLHNAWSTLTPPAIFIFDNRIEILSYGGLPYNLSLDSFYAGLSKPLNTALLGIFNSVKFSEQSGHGVPKIINAYSKDAFKFGDNTITVTLRFAFEPDFVIYRKEHSKKLDKLTKNQRNVYSYLKNNENCTLLDVSNELNLSLTGVKNIVSNLQEQNLVKRVGSKRDGNWLVI